MDKAYLVPVPGVRNFEEAAPLYAFRIKDEVQRQEGITCSVGVGPNKLIAKIAFEQHPIEQGLKHGECTNLYVWRSFLGCAVFNFDWTD